MRIHILVSTTILVHGVSAENGPSSLERLRTLAGEGSFRRQLGLAQTTDHPMPQLEFLEGRYGSSLHRLRQQREQFPEQQ